MDYPLAATPTLCPWASANTPKLVPDPKHDLFPFAQVTFTNGRERYVAWFNNGFMILVRPEKR